MSVYKYSVKDNQNEIKFLIELQELINDNKFTIKKTKEHYCCVDFDMCYKNQSIGYIELKCRYQSLKYFNSLIIGSTKLYRINEDYQNTLFVWIDKINDEIYFLPFTNELLNYKDEIMNGSYVKKIPKHLCKVGKTEFINYVHSSFSTV